MEIRQPSGQPAVESSRQQIQSEQLSKIENSFDALQHFLRTDGNPLNFQRETLAFIDITRSTLIDLHASQDFKTAFFISKKTEKVLAPILAALAQYDDQAFPIKQILNSISPSPIPFSPETGDLSKFLKLSYDVPPKKPNSKNAAAFSFCSTVLDFLIESVNNQGNIYMLRGKIDIALGFLIRALEARSQYMNSQAHQFQIGLIFINVAFCFKPLNQIEKTNRLLTKAILILENLEKELLFNKNEKDFKVSETSFGDRLLYLLSVSYKFYSDVLSKLSKQQEAEYCKGQSDSLMQQFKKKKKKILSKTSSVNSSFNTTSQMNTNNSSNLALTSKNIKTAFNKETIPVQDDNFSHASFQTVNTSTQSTTAFGGAPVSKDDIIFQKYIKLNETRYKIIILQIKESNCVQIILYSKPINLLKKIIVGFSSLVEYSHRISMPNAFSSQEPLNEFFKEISKRLAFEKGNLKIRDLEHYNTIEEFQKFSKILPKGIISSK